MKPWLIVVLAAIGGIILVAPVVITWVAFGVIGCAWGPGGIAVTWEATDGGVEGWPPTVDESPSSPDVGGWTTHLSAVQPTLPFNTSRWPGISGADASLWSVRVEHGVLGEHAPAMWLDNNQVLLPNIPPDADFVVYGDRDTFDDDIDPATAFDAFLARIANVSTEDHAAAKERFLAEPSESTSGMYYAGVRGELRLDAMYEELRDEAVAAGKPFDPYSGTDDWTFTVRFATAEARLVREDAEGYPHYPVTLRVNAAGETELLVSHEHEDATDTEIQTWIDAGHAALGLPTRPLDDGDITRPSDCSWWRGPFA